MQLNLKNLDQLKKVVDAYPEYDVCEIRKKTEKNPRWLAFGTGNIFRAYIARIGQDLINKKLMDSGIIAVESFSDEGIKSTLRPFDLLTLSVTLSKEGDFHTNLIGSIAESFLIKDNYDRMIEIFTDPDFQFASYTITEKGYGIRNLDGSLTDMVKEEMKGPAETAKNLMVQTAFLLYERYKKNQAPLTLLSIDNVSHNGQVLKDAILDVVKALIKEGRFEEDFYDYVNDPGKISFPWSMIDKITPAPGAEVEDYLVNKLGIEDAKRIDRGAGRPALAPFVNSEEAEYLVIEDDFVNGRPAFEKVGVYMTDRDTVNKVETMKVTSCLNPLHTTLAVYGCLLNIASISDCMKNQDLVALIKNICYKEALKVVVDPGIVDPKAFADQVIDVRFPNPYIPDQPQRIATDTSQKVAIRFGKTIESYIEKDKTAENLKYIPLALAGWLRYLLAVNDKGEEMTLSPDPLAKELQESLAGISLGHFKRTEGLENLLRNSSIFGLDLFEAGLGEKIIGYFEELTKGPGAVAQLLKKYNK